MFIRKDRVRAVAVLNSLPSLSEDEFQTLALDFAERFLALPIVQSNLLKCEVVRSELQFLPVKLTGFTTVFEN
jgi:hypothetical protein